MLIAVVVEVLGSALARGVSDRWGWTTSVVLFFALFAAAAFLFDRVRHNPRQRAWVTVAVSVTVILVLDAFASTVSDFEEVRTSLWWVGCVAAVLLGIVLWDAQRLREELRVVRSLGMSKLESGASISGVTLEGGYPRHLIMFVSTPNAELTWTADGGVLLVRAGHEPLELRRADDTCPMTPERLREIVTSADGANWLQAIRALAPHRENLEGIWLIGSGGERGSWKSLPELKKILGLVVSEDLVHIHSSPSGASLDFTDISRLLEEVRRVIREIRSQDRMIEPCQIIVDCTGGPKTASIAGAAITLGDGVRFQYVDQSGAVYLHDLRFEEGPSFG